VCKENIAWKDYQFSLKNLARDAVLLLGSQEVEEQKKLKKAWNS
jgi:hypothetical protein